MRLLSIESSAKAASVCLTEEGRLVAQTVQWSGLTHSRTLLQMAEHLLENCDYRVSDLDAVAVAKGPGSFTGVRIGVAAAKGLCWGGDLPAIGVSTLEAMAWHLADREGALVAACMDARRSEIYNALFRIQEGRPQRLTPDRAIPVSLLCAEVREPVYLVGDGAQLCAQALKAAGLPCLLAPEPLLMQSAWGVAKAAQGVAPQEAGQLTVNYLRLSQAERERLQRQN